MMITPFQTPNATYFQSAPCQTPTTRNTISEATLVGSTFATCAPAAVLPKRVFFIFLPALMNTFDIATG